MKSVMKHQFSRVPQANIPRSVFNRSHGHKTAFNAGKLIPIFCDEALPGDSFNLRMTIFARLSTPITPIMDNMVMDVHFFAVPIRLVWTNFQKFMGERDDATLYDPTDYIVPTITSPAVTGFTESELFDYMGLPIGIPGLEISALYSRAYNLIYNEWYRDENLIASVTVDKDDGPDDVADYVILSRGKRHDYFTSCLPWPQKGPSVPLPLGDEAPVLGIGKESQTFAQGAKTVYETGQSPNTTSYGANDNAQITSGTDNAFYVQEDPDNAGWPYIRADLSDAAAASINELRQAFQLQRLYERDARGGSRYTELIKSHFGVTSPDARLQRPEYLGGGSVNVNVVPVQQTSRSDAGENPLGTLAAYGTAAGGGIGFSKSFTEHCVLLGIVSVRADLTYQEGIPRHFLRSTRWDFYWPGLAHLGEQSVLNKEIYAQGTGHETDDEAVFGYQERYAEYRYKPSIITSTLRSTAASPLDMWHLAQEFGALPGLDETFITENPPMDRVLAVPAEPDFIADMYFDMKCARPMPVYSVPGLIDHF